MRIADTKNTALHLQRRADSFLSLSQVWGIGVILVNGSRWKARGIRRIKEDLIDKFLG